MEADFVQQLDGDAVAAVTTLVSASIGCVPLVIEPPPAAHLCLSSLDLAR